MGKYTWTELNEMNVDSLRRLVVDLGNENPEFVGMSKKQKPFLINALWNYFMSTGQASFEDAAEEVDEELFDDIDADENGDTWEDDDWDDDWDNDWDDDDDDDDGWEDEPEPEPEAPNGMAEAMGNPSKRDSKVLDGSIQRLNFDGMISRGVNASNVTVTISSGSMSNNYPVVGKSIYEVEKLLGQVLNVNPYARIVLVNGEEVTNDYIIREGDIVEFVNEAYDKG
jgi:hypothetical protein